MPTAVVIGNPVNPVATVEPEPSRAPQTAPTVIAIGVASVPEQSAGPGAVVVVVQPTLTPTLVEASVASIIVTSPTPEAAVRQFGATDTSLPSWVIPLYLVAQTGVIVLGLIAFIRRK